MKQRHGGKPAQRALCGRDGRPQAQHLCPSGLGPPRPLGTLRPAHGERRCTVVAQAAFGLVLCRGTAWPLLHTPCTGWGSVAAAVVVGRGLHTVSALSASICWCCCVSQALVWAGGTPAHLPARRACTVFPQRQSRVPRVGVLLPGNRVCSFHQSSAGAGVTLLNTLPATFPLLSLLCCLGKLTLSFQCSSAATPFPAADLSSHHGALAVLWLFPRPCRPRSLGFWPWLGSSLSLVPCCLLGAELASVPVPYAGDTGCGLSVVGKQSRPRSRLPADAGPATLPFERGTRRPAFWSCGMSSPTCLCYFWKHELHYAEPQFA